MAPVAIMIAQKLPDHSYGGNAFRHSYHYEPSARLLYVRVQRLESVSAFLTVCVHALAHIACGSMGPDSNPVFVAEFYRCQRVVHEQMFFAHARRSAALDQSPAPLEKLFARAKDDSQRLSLTDEILDAHLPPPADAPPAHLLARLEGYTGALLTTKMKGYLAAFEGTPEQGPDPVQQRLGELRGIQQAPSDPEPLLQNISTDVLPKPKDSSSALRSALLAQVRLLEDRFDSDTAAYARASRRLMDARASRSEAMQMREQLVQNTSGAVQDVKAALREVDARLLKVDSAIAGLTVSEQAALSQVEATKKELQAKRAALGRTKA
eukprot:Colp12_sorted_trinity150504_noHs@4718